MRVMTSLGDRLLLLLDLKIKCQPMLGNTSPGRIWQDWAEEMKERERGRKPGVTAPHEDKPRSHQHGIK